ncbi:ascorbate-specific phosphotransferase enzyme IIA component [Tissierella creatinophila DSM 6911]|uniref:Ascorbate-specific PTS system EIIA component n=2 Tax=Tissierella creatinophila TaxID=79681 RepID=A0A1U7M7A7_TISCR|nr:ascorbate-specific phosphotransferase enzyme IIA component [Tissierella creatinophila DSM 6911]
MLKDIITKDTIRLNVDAKDWEDAVRIGGTLLVNVHAAEERYVDAMIETVKDIGPYIVILEGIAMPHARPEKGALKMGMSLVTLKNPIEFGNEENDPVKLVISFCAVDSKTHLKALSQLMVLLEDEDNIESILHSDSVDDVIRIINSFSK